MQQHAGSINQLQHQPLSIRFVIVQSIINLWRYERSLPLDGLHVYLNNLIILSPTRSRTLRSLLINDYRLMVYQSTSMYMLIKNQSTSQRSKRRSRIATYYRYNCLPTSPASGPQCQLNETNHWYTHSRFIWLAKLKLIVLGSRHK